MEIEDKDIQWASQHFLTDSLPDDWQKMSDKEVDEFIENHKWQPIEDWEIDDIWQQIGQIARSMRSYIKKQASEQKG
jgi:3'-phosphoadenosine 5'-phosphosulfate sulfotransferase (PAPS reductase)/FAD synthetase